MCTKMWNFCSKEKTLRSCSIAKLIFKHILFPQLVIRYPSVGDIYVWWNPLSELDNLYPHLGLSNIDIALNEDLTSHDSSTQSWQSGENNREIMRTKMWHFCSKEKTLTELDNHVVWFEILLSSTSIAKLIFKHPQFVIRYPSVGDLYVWWNSLSELDNLYSHLGLSNIDVAMIEDLTSHNSSLSNWTW